MKKSQILLAKELLKKLPAYSEKTCKELIIKLCLVFIESEGQNISELKDAIVSILEES